MTIINTTGCGPPVHCDTAGRNYSGLRLGKAIHSNNLTTNGHGVEDWLEVNPPLCLTPHNQPQRVG